MSIQRAGHSKQQTTLSQRIKHRIKLGVGILLLGALTGCVGVDGGYYGETTVVDTGPDVGFWGGYWGGGYRHGHDDYRFSNRGAASRAVAHGGGGHGGGGHR